MPTMESLTGLVTTIVDWAVVNAGAAEATSARAKAVRAFIEVPDFSPERTRSACKIWFALLGTQLVEGPEGLYLDLVDSLLWIDMVRLYSEKLLKLVMSVTMRVQLMGHGSGAKASLTRAVADAAAKASRNMAETTVVPGITNNAF
jgi:hypothetical protein